MMCVAGEEIISEKGGRAMSLRLHILSQLLFTTNQVLILDQALPSSLDQ